VIVIVFAIRALVISMARHKLILEELPPFQIGRQRGLDEGFSA
jgi:hypothetical protein